MSIDAFFTRKYCPRTYNCGHYSIELMKHITGVDYTPTLSGFLCAPTERVARLGDLRAIEFLPKPVSPCFVYMKQVKSVCHLAVWYMNRVIHIFPNSTVQSMPLEVARIGFPSVRFFRVKC